MRDVLLDGDRVPITSITRDRVSTDVIFVTRVEEGSRAEILSVDLGDISLDLIDRSAKVFNYFV